MFTFFSYAYFKLIAWGGIAFLISYVRPKVVFGGLLLTGLLEAVLAFLQFTYQKSLGLSFLGESVLNPLNKELAKTAVDGGLLIRAYGTFPHPNVLAAFLILSLVAAYYFFVKTTSNSFRLAGVVCVFTLWLGILLTFARAGWLIAVLTTCAFIALALNFGFRKKEVARLVVITVVIVLFLAAFFHWAVAPRLDGLTPDNFTVQERLGDYTRAWQLIQERPWLGRGLTLAMGNEPIHNFYLTIIVEIGFVGLLILIALFVYLIRRGLYNWDKVVAIIMLGALLAYGFFDHFLWTLRPGIGMLALVIGVLLYNERSKYEN